MLISALIDQLEEIRRKNGEIDVFVKSSSGLSNKHPLLNIEKNRGHWMDLIIYPKEGW